jgi:hypothetical protein
VASTADNCREYAASSRLRRGAGVPSNRARDRSHPTATSLVDRLQCQQTRRRVGDHDRVVVPLALLILTVLSGCAAGEHGSTREAKGGSEAAPRADAVGEPGCQPPTPLRPTATGFPEARGSGSVTAWALLWVEPPWPVGQEVKVVWRMTGTGDFAVVARGPNEEVVDAVQGPTPHVGSSWERSGDEWGTFFVLTSPGCWRLEASRGTDMSTVYVFAEEEQAVHG